MYKKLFSFYHAKIGAYEMVDNELQPAQIAHEFINGLTNLDEWPTVNDEKLSVQNYFFHTYTTNNFVFVAYGDNQPQTKVTITMDGSENITWVSAANNLSTSDNRTAFGTFLLTQL